METLWYFIVAVMLAVYVVLDGFDFGAGIVSLFVARSERERQEVLSAIGAFWDGNEVWLLAGGGTLFFAFPRAYAVGFSGFYLPLMLVLWLLIMRGMAMELRSHQASPLWRQLWDGILALASFLIAIVLGAALGNVIRGVPLDGSGYFQMGLFATGNDTRRNAAWIAMAAALVSGIVTTVLTAKVRPELYTNLLARPWAWPAVLVVSAAAGTLPFLHRRRREGLAFIASALLIAGLLAASAAGVFPVLLRSTVSPEFTLDISNASAADHGLRTGLVWFCIALPLACGYFVYLLRSFRGKVQLEADSHD